MPTAAKMLAMILNAALVWWVSSRIIVPLFDPDFAEGSFVVVNTALAALFGWTIVGANAGRGWADGVTFGVTGMVVVILVAILVYAGNEMLDQALNRRFAGPVAAFEGMTGNALENGRFILRADVLIPLLGGGALIGLLAEAVSRVAR